MLWSAPGTAIGSIVAHQGGWDEILLVAGPIVVIVVLLRIAKRRVDRSAAELAASQDDATLDPSDATDSSGSADPSDVTDRA